MKFVKGKSGLRPKDRLGFLGGRGYSNTRRSLDGRSLFMTRLRRAAAYRGRNHLCVCRALSDLGIDLHSILFAIRHDPAVARGGGRFFLASLIMLRIPSWQGAPKSSFAGGAGGGLSSAPVSCSLATVGHDPARAMGPDQTRFALRRDGPIYIRPARLAERLSAAIAPLMLLLGLTGGLLELILLGLSGSPPRGPGIRTSARACSSFCLRFR